MGHIEELQEVAERLSDKSEEIRYSAVKELLQGNSIGALPLYMNAVSDVSYRVRENALRGICSFPPEEIFPRLEAFLRDNENANCRTAAMEAYIRYGRDAAPYLLRLLEDYDEEIRTFSAVMLGDVEGDLHVEGLIKALSDPDENVRHAAAEALGKVGNASAVGPLIECLDKGFWLRYPAVIALGNIGDSSATEHLVKLLDDDMLKQAVVEALGKIGDVSAVGALAGLLSQDDASVRNDAIASLVKIQSWVARKLASPGAVLPSIKKTLDNENLINHLLEALRDDNMEIRKNAIIALGWLKEKRAIKSLVSMLEEYDLEEYVVGSLVSIGEDSLPELIQMLKQSEPGTRVSIIRCIGWIDNNLDGIKCCIEFLKDDDIEVRLQALGTMSGGLELEEVENALLELLSDPEPDIQVSLIELLGKSRSEKLVNKLMEELSNDNPTRKLGAIQILGRIKNKNAIVPMKRLLEDRSDEIRAEAYRALSMINTNGGSAGLLLEGLTDSSPTVRKASAGSISAGAGEEAQGNLIHLLRDPDPEVRIVAVEALGKTGNSSCIVELIDAYGEDDQRLKLAVLRALRHFKDKASIHFLSDVLKHADSDLKRTAAESLSEIGDDWAISGLIVAMDDKDWSVRSAAVSALGKLGNKRSISHIVERLEDSEDIVKKAAINSLAQLGAKETIKSILPLIYDDNLQLEVLEALEKLGIPELEYFSGFFNRCNTRNKSLLIDLLGRLKGADVRSYLEHTLEDEFFTVRCRAAKALGELGDTKAIRSLTRAQKNDPSVEVQREAALALKRLNSKPK